MANQFPINLTPEIIVRDGKAVTSSQSVAAFFIKRHDDVLRKIRSLECSPEFHARNFAEMLIDLKVGNGAIRKTPTYQMTKNGFVFLVMGFTGQKAAQFKEAYIAEFDRMEDELVNQRYGEITKITGSNDLKSMIDKLQQMVHEGEFIPAGQAAQEYSFPKTKKSRSQILNDFLRSPEDDTLHQLLAYLKRDGHNVEEAERVLMWLRDYMCDMGKTINTIITHAQYIEHAVSKL